MSLVVAGPDNRVVMAAPNRPMLTTPLPITPPPGARAFTRAVGLSGWWDAGAAAGLLDATNKPLASLNAPAAAIIDKSGGAALAVWHAAPSGANPPLATPRLSGLLGGLGRSMIVPPNLPAAGQQLPLMDPDQGLVSTAFSFGSATPWTIFLVWSRPNWRQSADAPSTLLSFAGADILSADNSAGTRLVLFPGVNQTVLSTTLARRHTHALILRNTPDAGIDVWLDATQVAAAAPNPLPPLLHAPLLFLHNGALGGGAECWFHEAAMWSAALDANAVSDILSYQACWALGPRKGIQVLVTGQSNAGNGLLDGAWHLLAQGVAWHLGALGYGVVGSYGSQPAATCIHGEGIYPVPALGLTGSFLDDPGTGADPSTWPLGADGQALQAWLQSDTKPEDAADVAAILWPWSEDDSTRQYAEKPTYEAAARRLLALQRGMLSRAAASPPQAWWSAIPFDYGSNGAGMQMQREVVADLAADATQNVSVALPQTADSLPRGTGGLALTYDPATGVWSGGDPLHRDTADNRRFGVLAAPLVARAVLANGGGDTITAIPDGIPARGGPVVTHAYRESDTSLVVTVRHDAGTDLIVPATRAASGIGWAVVDGGSAAVPERIVAATACVRLNTTQLRLTLGTALANPSAACRLFYPYGAATIGRGNAVTDNLSAVTPPTGWDIAADLDTTITAPDGSSLDVRWRWNMPVHVPMSPDSGITLSDSP